MNELASQPSATPPSAPALSGLGIWNLYFLLKFGLFWKELIGFHALENLAFALALLVPLTSPRGRLARTLFAVPFAIALLYYDSWLPPIGRVLSQAGLVSSFSLPYLIELIGRFLNIPTLAMLVALSALYLILVRWVRFSVLVIGALCFLLVDTRSTVPTVTTPAPAADEPTNATSKDPATAYKEFFAHEATRSVSFGRPPADAPPFDVIFLHVCSLSWDDLRFTGLDAHPLFKRFDYLFTRFNSAASYSGPAAIRIQRAACGQQEHGALYNPAAAKCYLMENLRQAGFEPALALNHDGHFDDFLKFVQAQGGMQVPPLSLAGVPVRQRSFDDSPIYDDRAVLTRWLERRRESSSQNMALYFNTVSLHDGNRTVGGKIDEDSVGTYKTRLAKLLDDLDAFMNEIESSGRRAVVAIIPEHGAALRGDKMQITGLREIPSPAITLVPVGVKIIGPQLTRAGEPLKIDEPSSYLAVSEIVARLLARPPFTAASFQVGDYVANLPRTDFVAENENVAVMARGAGYLMRQGNGPWSDYK